MDGNNPMPRPGSFFSQFEPTSSAGRIVPMEGMRGLAALLVFFVHFRALFGNYAEGTFLYSTVQMLGALGHTGVDLFFILSGYLIYGIVMNQRFRVRRFVTRRVRRLYPTFIAVFVIYLCASVLLRSRSRIPTSIGDAGLYIAANVLMLPGIFHIKPLITVAWSLSYEWFFYLFLPAVVWALGIRRRSWKSRALLFAIISLVPMVFSALRYDVDPRLALFGAGVLLWELAHNTRILQSLPPAAAVPVAVLFIVNLLAIGFHGSHAGSFDLVLTYVPSFYAPSLYASGLLLTLCSISGSNILSRMFSWNPLRWVGNMSYSYYLIHGATLVSIQVVLRRISRSTHLSAPGVLALFAFCFAAALASSTLLYLIIEKPFSFVRDSREKAPVTPRIAIDQQRAKAAAGDLSGASTCPILTNGSNQSSE